MKIMFFGLAALAVAWSTLAPPPAARSVQPINSIVGDASYLAAFGRTPQATTDEDLRIRTHLHYVLARLRAVPESRVAPELRAARARNLERLAAYVKLGQFPRNPASVHGRTPNFIDTQGRICAVGYLVREDLGAGAVAAINRAWQFARIFEMRSAALDAWQETSGLTMLELASIQPEYCEPNCPPPDVPPFDDYVARDVDPTPVTAAEVLLGGGSAALSGMNVWTKTTGRHDRALGIAAMTVGLGSVLLSMRNEAGMPAFNVLTGTMAILTGFVQARGSSGAKDRTGMATRSFDVGPMIAPDGSQALAVQVRF